ncbi:Imm1 family immunity protein [Plantactinospora sp. ZYX-F-223]|uniref:Imm1 family immunity protein n=1 Tax=Plantactinospora sp. ZYX-F-223 TaxID=3144103 RepID=UPI0031FDECA3
MTTYEVTWLGTGHALVETPDEVEALLISLHEAGQPVVVDVFRYRDESPAGGAQVGVGHPERSFVLYFGQPEGGYAVEPGIPAWDGDIEFSYGGQATDYHPAETKITPARAFKVVCELVGTDERPTSVNWDEQATEPDAESVTADDPWT